MTDDLQPGQHPDADTLNAFAEDALPAHEREQTLAHLAACGHCREVVSLAAPPMEVEPQRQFAPLPRRWFTSWQLALPVVGFAAAALIVVLAVHRQNSIKSDSGPTLTARNDEPEHESVPQPRTVAPAVNVPPPAAVSTPVTSLAKPSLQAPIAAPRDSFAVAGAGSANGTLNTLQAQDVAVNGRSTTALSFGGAAAGSSLSQPAAAPPANAAVTAAPAAMPPPPPAAAPSTLALSDSNTAEVAADAITIATSAKSTATTMRGLPSGRAIVSSITRDNQTLALDRAGALFVSVDNGQHWKAVPSQWQGRAVKVALALYPSPLTEGGAAFGAYTATAIGGPILGAAAISGKIYDPTGAVIGGADVVLKDASARVVRSIKADASGQYALDGLTAGTYQLEASSQGFVERRTVTTLAAGQRLPLDLALQVGSASESVVVTAETAVRQDQSVVRKRSLARAPAKEPARIVPPVMLFELITDSGERWSSADGLNWKRN